jgi:methyl-accepting chemotaxis protein
MSVIKKFSSIKLKVKLPALVMASVLVTIVALSALVFYELKKLTILEFEEQMSVINTDRKIRLEKYLHDTELRLTNLSHYPFMVESMRALEKSWKDLSNPSEHLLKHYVHENPFPEEQKLSYTQANDGSNYSKAHVKYHDTIKTFMLANGYHDIIMIDPHGNIVYTVSKEPDFATNLISGPYSSSDLAKAYRDALHAPETQVNYYDFKPFAAAKGRPQAFLSKPVIDPKNGENLGVLVIALPIDSEIKEIVSSKTGLQDTGQSYLIGTDMIMRNNMREDLGGGGSMELKVDMPEVKDALSGKHGLFHTIDYMGEDVLGAYDYMDFHGTRYALMTKINTEEILHASDAIKQEIGIASLVILVVMALLGFLASRGIISSLAVIAGVAEDLADKKTNVDLSLAEREDEIGDLGKSMVKLKQSVYENLLMQTMTSEYPVVRCDRDFTITFVNEASVEQLKILEKHLPCKANELMGKSIDIFHKNPQHQRGMLKAMVESDRHSTRIAVGDQFMALMAKPLFDEKGEFDGAYISWSIITDQVRAEESVKLAQESINDVISAAREGILDKRIDASKFEGFYKDLAESMNGLMDTIVKPISAISECIQTFSQGDLTQEFEGDYKGDFADLQSAYNNSMANLRSLMTKIKEATTSVKTASQEISAGSSDLSMRTEQQASSLEETAASMQELTETVAKNATDSAEANNISSEARSVADRGGEDVKQVVSAMQGIQESSTKISDIISVIDEIAFQTNLLALNAAVEAARAGEAGKGFAVVASEVRNLAGRSASASKEIKELIVTSGKQVTEGVDLVEKSAETLNDIVSSVGKVAELIAGISNASNEQSEGIKEVNAAVTQMDEMTQQNAALVEENTAAIQSMMAQSDALDRLIRQFKVDEDGHDSDMAVDAEPAPKPAVKKPAAKPASGPTAKPAPKPAAKPAGDSADKKESKPAPKPAGGSNDKYSQGWEEF